MPRAERWLVAVARAASAMIWLRSARTRQGTDELVITADTYAVTRRHYTPFGDPRGTTPTTWPGGDQGYVGGTQDTTTGLFFDGGGQCGILPATVLRRRPRHTNPRPQLRRMVSGQPWKAAERLGAW